MFRDDDPGLARCAPSRWASPRRSRRSPTAGPRSSCRRCSPCTAAAPRPRPKGDYIQYPHSIMVKVDESDRRALEQDSRFFYPAYLGPSGWLGLDFTAPKGRLGRGARAGRRVVPDGRAQEAHPAARRSLTRRRPTWFDRGHELREPVPRRRDPDGQRLRVPVRQHRRRRRRPRRAGGCEDGRAKPVTARRSAQIDSFAGALADRGIGVGDVVGLLAPNSSAFAVAFHGILRAGATATTINVLFTAKDIVKQLTDSKAKMLITVSPLLPQAKEAAAAVGHVRRPAGGARRGADGHPSAEDLLGRGARCAGGQLRPRDTPGRAALQLGHDRQSQGRDAHPSQPGRQRRADPPGAGRAVRRRRHRDHAVLPHLRNDGAAQRRSACAGAAGDDAELRPRGVPRQHRRTTR